MHSITASRVRTGTRPRRLIGMLSVLALICAAMITGTTVQSAAAAEYPSWSDVQAARADQAASQAQVIEIQGLIRQLESNLAAAQAEAERLGILYQEAEQKYFEATIKAEELKTQAEEAAAKASESQTRAGQLAAQIARTGTNDLTLKLFMNGDDAENMLAMMGQAGKVSESANLIYEQAILDRNTAQSLTDQANVASSVLEGLKAEAEAASNAALRAQEAAAAAVAESEQHRVVLEAQLVALTSAADTTQAQYEEGVRIEQERIEAERRAAAARAAQQAADAAAARAAAAAAGNSGGGGGGGGGGGSAGGSAGTGGWVKPATGYISSGYGYRIHPVSGGTRLHSGTDLAGGCGIPIYAAHSGTVAYAGVYGTYGNWVLINNGDGVSTGYAHIVNGGIQVSVGQSVSAGDVIAYVGSTGASTGCHLHFEVRINGVATNAVPYMQARNISLG